MSAFLIVGLLFECVLLNLQPTAAREKTSDITIFTSNLIGANLRSGDHLELHCGITNADKAIASWWRGETKLSDGNHTLTNDSRVSLHAFLDKPFWSPVDGFTNLVIKDIRMSEAGQYTCTATPLNKSKKAVSHTQDVNVDYKILFGALGYPRYYIEIPEGDTLALSCNGTGNSKPTIKWTVEGVRENPRDLPQFNGVQNLTIDHVNYTDSGWYNCVVDNGTSDPFITTRVAVRVLYPPKFVPDSFASLRNVRARTGAQAVVTCNFSARPPGQYTVKWFHKHSNSTGGDQRQEIIADDRHEVQNSFEDSYDNIVAHLTINSVQEGDLGKYFCVAQNERGSGEGEVGLLKKD